MQTIVSGVAATIVWFVGFALGAATILVWQSFAGANKETNSTNEGSEE